MTLGDVKKLFYALIDEYAPDTIDFTEDEDARDKANSLFMLAYQEMADLKPIMKTKELSHTYTGSEGYTEVSLPTYKQLKKVIVIDANNVPVSGDYYFVGQKKIYISNKTDYKYIVEYTVEPTVINDETDEDFELEIDQDAQMFLPYRVASDYLKTDPSANYSAFESEYQNKLQQFNTSKKGIMVEITEGEF